MLPNGLLSWRIYPKLHSVPWYRVYRPVLYLHLVLGFSSEDGSWVRYEAWGGPRGSHKSLINVDPKYLSLLFRSSSLKIYGFNVYVGWEVTACSLRLPWLWKPIGEFTLASFSDCAINDPSPNFRIRSKKSGSLNINRSIFTGHLLLCFVISISRVIVFEGFRLDIVQFFVFSFEAHELLMCPRLRNLSLL